ncbi:hypothetical protein [Brevundimonas sp.]|uniref:hypothetical protein n=1 Tax=Brevundimonas sp. TaxID=1871086 RepID=UPI002ED97DFC
MGSRLLRLRRLASSQQGRETTSGFALLRGSRPPGRFNRLVERIIDEAGDDYIALPTTDGSAGYERVFIIPLD